MDLRRISDLHPNDPLVKGALPSLGFFGGTWADCLDIPVKGAVTKVRIVNLSKAPEFLNLRGVLARRHGQTVDIDDGDLRIAQSSDRPESNLLPQGLTSLGGIHTLRESGAWWEVSLSEPVEIDQLLIFNRADGLWTRAQRLRVSVTDENGRETTVYDSTSAEYIAEVLHVIEAFGGGPLHSARCDNEAFAAKWRAAAVRDIAGKLRIHGVVPSAQEWLKLAALLPADSGRSMTGGDLEGDDWFLLAYGLCCQIARDARTRTGVRAYSRVLNSEAKLRRLDCEFGDVTRAMGVPEIHHVRHGLEIRGKLRATAPRLATLVERLKIDLEPLEMTPMLAYGSLLGAIRDGKLIEHDDDFDLFVVVPAASKDDFASAKRAFHSVLVDAGWTVDSNEPYHNAHASLPNVEAVLDIFAVWLDGDQAWTHMAGMRWEALPAEWFSVGDPIMVDGISTAAPGNSREFLARRYGDSWATPDKFHDWRWPLKS